MIRECRVLWDLILVNMHNLDVYSKHPNLISLLDGSDSCKKVDKLLMVEEQSECTAFNELNFNSPFRWFRATRLRSPSAHGIIWLLLLLPSLSSSISLPLSCFQSDNRGSRAGATTGVIPRGPVLLTQITATEPQRNNSWEELVLCSQSLRQEHWKGF